jgi:hypothetical protein
MSTAERAVSAWMGPAALAVLATYVFAGEPAAPLLTLLVAAAPCLALLRMRDTLPASTGHAAVAVPGLAVMIAANAAVAGEMARLLALPRLAAPALILLLTLLPLQAAHTVIWRVVAVIGVAAALAPALTVAIVTGTPPWQAWRHIAARPALVFGEHSEWVTTGRAVATTTTIAFDEPQRVTAVTAAVWRVTEHDGARVATRERRLAAGEAVVFRPGDELTIDRGARLRFEAGKRVPGAVVSGATWADPTGRRGWPGALRDVGVVVAVVGAAMALVPPVASARVPGTLAVVLPLALAAVAAVSGVYAMYVAPDIALGRASATVLHDLPASALGGVAAAPLAAVVGLGVLALHAASASAILERVRAALGTGALSAPPIVRGVWLAISIGAAAAAFVPTGASVWFLLGAGLLASLWTAPALAAVPPRASALGAVVGAAVFVACAMTGIAPPVVLAAPAAWAAAAVLGRQAGVPEVQ